MVSIWAVPLVLPNLISLGIVLNCLEDTSEEACNADGVYAVLQNQRWGVLRTGGRSFDNKLHFSVKTSVTCDNKALKG
jgi:hypothetical protein